MSSPFVQRPGMFGVQPASAGALAVPAGAPPFYKDCLHWFDFTDDQAVFADVLGTVPITDGVEIKYVKNKGRHGHSPAVDDIVSANPDWDSMVTLIGELGVADSGAGVGQPITWSGPEGIDVGAAGATWAHVVKDETGGTAHTYFNWNGPGFDSLGSKINFGSWQGQYNNNSRSTNKLAIIGEWVWFISSWFPDGTVAAQASGDDLETGGPHTPVAVIPDGSLMELAGLRGDEGETIIWQRAIPTIDWPQIIAYFDNKYGVLPVGP